MFVGFVGHHKEVLVRDDWAETLVCAADETLSRAEDVQKLLWIVIFTKRPETASNAASHDDAVVVHDD